MKTTIKKLKHPVSKLLQTLTASEYRKDLLFLLCGRSQKPSDIREHFEVTSPELALTFNKMLDSGMIQKNDDEYRITELGEIIAKVYKPFLDTVTAIEANDVFWRNHDLSTIPKELLYQIRDLKDCRIVKVEEYNIDKSHPEFESHVKNSERIIGAACMFRKSWVDLILEKAAKGIPIDIIVTSGVLSRIKEDHFSDLEYLLTHRDAHIYVCEGLTASFIVTNEFFSLSLNYKTVKHHDTINDMVGFDKAAREWGTALFEYYLNNALVVKSAHSLNEMVIQAPTAIQI